MSWQWKKTLIIALDSALAVYLVLAVTSFNKPKEDNVVCRNVTIDIEDTQDMGFLDKKDIKDSLTKAKIYPVGKRIVDVNPRAIEDKLRKTSFVNTAQCFKTEGGEVKINITQRTPVIRIKGNNGKDYYIDDKGGIMPNSSYTSDLVIATGSISTAYAKAYLAPLALTIMDNKTWRDFIEQINILPTGGVEIVPRVGNHIIHLGELPRTKDAKGRREKVEAFMKKKMTRLYKFYKYGLSEAGWNKYSYINIEFDNQIICKKRNNTETENN